MITPEQVAEMAKKVKINEAVIFREYLQLVFLQKFYQKPASRKVFFKGGTALHLVFQAPRFSEDLDFSATLSMSEFDALIASALKRMENEEGVTWKEKKSVAGRRFLLTAEDFPPYKAYISLDFSFREKIFSDERSVIQTAYPVLFTSYVHHLSRDEILAEKIRAVMTRRKGRDLYDLWYLFAAGARLDWNMVKKKLAYYEISNATAADVANRVASFSKKSFVLDLRPFVPLHERARLPDFFEMAQAQIQKALADG